MFCQYRAKKYLKIVEMTKNEPRVRKAKQERIAKDAKQKVNATCRKKHTKGMNSERH